MLLCKIFFSGSIVSGGLGCAQLIITRRIPGGGEGGAEEELQSQCRESGQMAARILLTVRTSICPVCLIAFGPGVVMPIEFCLTDCLLSCLILYIFVIPN